MKKIKLTTEDNNKRLTQMDRIEQILKRNKGKRVSAMDIYLVSGSLSIATQISYLRRHRLMTIDNKLEQQPSGIKWSFYKLAK